MEVDFVVLVVFGSEDVFELAWVVVEWAVEDFEVEEAVMISTMEVVGVVDVDLVQDAVVIWTIDVVEVVADSFLEAKSVVSFSWMLFDVLIEVVGSVEVVFVLLEVAFDFVEAVVAALAVLVEIATAAVPVAHPELESTVL